MLDMKVTGLTLRDVSITYTTTEGKVEAWGRAEHLPIAEQISDHLTRITRIPKDLLNADNGTGQGLFKHDLWPSLP